MTKENEKINKQQEHIEQLVTGFIRFGNAGIDKKKKEKGYATHHCSMDENSRFVDMALNTEHLRQIIDGAEEMLKVIESKEEINK